MTETETQQTVIKTPQPDTKGWWSLPKLRGSLDGVCVKVDAAPDVPDHWKLVIKTSIKAKCEADKANFVYLDAHWFIAGSKANITITIETDTVL